MLDVGGRGIDGSGGNGAVVGSGGNDCCCCMISEELSSHGARGVLDGGC